MRAKGEGMRLLYARPRQASLRKFLMTVGLCSLLAFPVLAQQSATLPDRVRRVMSRPEFAHANFGIEFYSLDSDRVIYEVNSNKLMVPGSTAKLLTEGTILELLGGD